MTENSKQAYATTGEIRQTHRQRCLKGLERETNGLTYPQLAVKIGLTQQQTWKRLSELHTENLIMICGTTDTYSRYRLVREPGLFPVEKVPTFTKWCKKEYPDIWNKYSLLIRHEL